MSDDHTPRLGLPYMAAGQAQKHLTLNEALSALDGYVGLAVESRTVATQPAAPADGVLYMIPAGGSTGADWAARAANTIVRFEAGGWIALATFVGQFAYVKDENRILIRAVTNDWRGIGNYVSSLSNLTGVGIGTAQDPANLLTVRAASALFAGVSAGFQIKLNKVAAGDTASLLYQTGFSGRAEIGLTGDDKLHLKVSADGSSWTEAWVTDSSGRTGFGVSAPTARVQVDGAMRVKSYVKTALPSASAEGAGAMIYVSNDAAGATLAFSDGADWRRVHDRAVVA